MIYYLLTCNFVSVRVLPFGKIIELYLLTVPAFNVLFVGTVPT